MPNTPSIPLGENPFLRQEGGNHYSKLAIQPVLFATVNQYDPAAFSILKYLTRFKDKNGVEDLRKARHFVEIRQAFMVSGDVGCLIAPPRITMRSYIVANGLTGHAVTALTWLDDWVYGRGDEDTQNAESLKAVIDAMIHGAV